MSYLEGLFGLTGQNTVVIGGSGVLGSAMSEGLARAGANVAILGRNLAKAQQQAERIKTYGVASLAIQADVTSKQALQSACDQIEQVWQRVDILVNAPGVNSATPFFDVSEQEWEEIMAINLKGVFLACQIFGKQMLARQSGNIINISSMASGPPLSTVFTYSISKAGLNNLTQNLAREWAGQGIRVNAILPGFFPAQQNKKLLTPERKAAILGHTPMGRFGESGELIGTLLWLAADKGSSFVTGALIPVDGGFSAMSI
jgi:NAD(P)-dependent dehydrogenase (short-subunit alcohol dehydrogenase family)